MPLNKFKLPNFGSNCYINSVLHQLANLVHLQLPSAAKVVRRRQLSLNDTSDYAFADSLSQLLACMRPDVLKKRERCSQPPPRPSPEENTAARPIGLIPSQQGDPHEYLCLVLLFMEWPFTFGHRMARLFDCGNCGLSRTSAESGANLESTLTLSTMSSEAERLVDVASMCSHLLCPTTQLDYRCQSCHVVGQCVTSTRFYHMSPLVIFQLSLFHHDLHQGPSKYRQSLRGIQDRVDGMSLLGFICHIGESINHGHYISIIKNVHDPSEFHIFNDDAAPIRLRAVELTRWLEANEADPYLLIYWIDKPRAMSRWMLKKHDDKQNSTKLTPSTNVDQCLPMALGPQEQSVSSSMMMPSTFLPEQTLNDYSTVDDASPTAATSSKSSGYSPISRITITRLIGNRRGRPISGRRPPRLKSYRNLKALKREAYRRYSNSYCSPASRALDSSSSSSTDSTFSFTSSSRPAIQDVTAAAAADTTFTSTWSTVDSFANYNARLACDESGGGVLDTTTTTTRKRRKSAKKNRDKNQSNTKRVRSDPDYVLRENLMRKTRRQSIRRQSTDDDYHLIEALIQDYERDVRLGPDKVCVECGQTFFDKYVRKFYPDDARELFGDSGQDKFDATFCVRTKHGDGSHYICEACHRYYVKGAVSPLSLDNAGLAFPQIPDVLSTLNTVEERLVAPRIAFIRIKRYVVYEGQKRFIGSILCVPVNVEETVKQLPRSNSDPLHSQSDCIEYLWKKRQLNQYPYIKQTVRPARVIQALDYLASLENGIYKQEGVLIDQSWLAEQRALLAPHHISNNLLPPPPPPTLNTTRAQSDQQIVAERENTLERIARQETDLYYAYGLGELRAKKHIASAATKVSVSVQQPDSAQHVPVAADNKKASFESARNGVSGDNDDEDQQVAVLTDMRETCLPAAGSSLPGSRDKSNHRQLGDDEDNDHRDEEDVAVPVARTVVEAAPAEHNRPAGILHRLGRQNLRWSTSSARR